MRRSKFNRGAWELQRERFRIEDRTPPEPEHCDPVGAVIGDVLKSMGLDQQWRQASIAEKWPDIVGPQIAAQTQPARVYQGVLTVFVSHPIWLSELERFHKQTILRRVQEQCPDAKVRAIRFQVTPDADRGAYGSSVPN